jgi:hypothetical protein
MLQNFPTYVFLDAFQGLDALGWGIAIQNLGDLTSMVFHSLFVFRSHNTFSIGNTFQFSLPHPIFATLRCSLLLFQRLLNYSGQPALENISRICLLELSH